MTQQPYQTNKTTPLLGDLLSMICCNCCSRFVTITVQAHMAQEVLMWWFSTVALCC